MFGLLRRRVPYVHSHWMVPLLDFQSDAPAFYDDIEEELRERQMPDVEITRIPFKEGGWLSARRDYLRIRRELLVFDVCSAAYGTGWYFSARGASIPSSLRVWEALVALATLVSLMGLYWVSFGFFMGCIVMGATVIAIAAVFISAGHWQNIDDALMQIPVVGTYYLVFFRPETYFRQDGQLMFIELVDQIIRKKVAAYAAANGVTEVEFKSPKEPPQPKGFIELFKKAFGIGDPDL